jgi:hypothetical protein
MKINQPLKSEQLLSRNEFERPMGYFLAGLIDGDGHISKNVTISFHKRDIKLHKKSKIT